MDEIRLDELDMEQRRKKIAELIAQQGKVKVAGLSKLFGISEVTIRNDLSGLESEGLLERTHGGAISTHRMYYNMSLKERMKTNEAEKKSIALRTASLILDGDTVMINSGSTTIFVIRELKNHKNLTVVTNSLSVAEEAIPFKNIHIILIGGNMDAQYQFTYGDDTVHQLGRYKADKLILSADGVSFEDGISTYHHLEAEVNRQMIARVNKTIVVADYTKIGMASFAYIDSIDSIDTLVTNKEANAEEIGQMAEKGIEVKLV